MNSLITTQPQMLVGITDTLKADFIASKCCEFNFYVLPNLTGSDQLYEQLIRQTSQFAIVENELLQLSDFNKLYQFKRISLYTKIILFADKSEYKKLKRIVEGLPVSFLNKTCKIQDFEECLETVSKNQIYVATELEQHLGRINEQFEKEIEICKKLSPREWQVFQQMGKGMTESVIAQTLHMGISTLKTHKKNITRKLLLKGQQKLTYYALRVLGKI